MKTVGRVLLSIFAVLVVLLGVAYVDGAMLPVDHSATVMGVVDAPPAEVFSMITNVASAPEWRKSVKEVKVLPEDAGRDHWIEDLGHGQTMEFLAVRTDRVNTGGVGRRDVLLSEPNASYGGTWTYLIAPGDAPNRTRLSITETGFIKPPMYRFMMRHVFGMTANLDEYMAEIKKAAGQIGSPP